MCRISWLLFLLLFDFGLTVRAQEPRTPPTDSIYLTVDLNTGQPTIFWAPPAINSMYPDPTGYIIYKKIVDILAPNGRIEPIDTVGPSVRSYIDLNSNGNSKRQSYLLASNGPVEPSQLSNLHSSIFITAFYDSCNRKIDLTWENYQGWGNRIKKYSVYIGNTPDWHTYQLYANLSGTINHVSILNVIENQDYYFYVEAQKDTTAIGGHPFIAKSNLFHKYTYVNPMVLSFNPVNNSTEVTSTENLILTFNENVKQGTAGNIVIYNSNASVFETIPYNDSRITISGSTVTINHSGSFVNGSAYYINMDANVIQDMAGNAYSGIFGSTAWNFVIQSTSAVSDIFNAEVLIYPNPTNGIFKIHCSENERLSDVCIFDIDGKMLKQLRNIEGNEVFLNLSEYAKGIYIIKIQINEMSCVKRMIVN